MPEYKSSDAQWYMDRGSMIHLATELYDEGTLDESTVDPQIVGYLESYKQLPAVAVPVDTFTGIEVQLVDTIYGYAGTIDRIYEPCVVDIKSGQPSAWHVIQLGAYYGLCRANKIEVRMGKAIYLHEDGSLPNVKSYTLKELQDGLKIFLSALVVVRARREMGMI